MAVAATTVFEVRTTGSDLNGGGFDPSLGGTDYSQQNSAQATGTVTSVGTTVTATTSIFTSVMVGNLITDGTTWKEITAFTSATIVTVDSAPSWTAASIKVGGALANLQTAINASNGSNLIWVKQGSGYSTSANITGGVGVVPGNNSTTLPNRIYGYGTTRGDGGKATITAASGCTIVLAMTTDGWWIQNLVIDCASIANVAINYGGNWWQVANCTLKNFKAVWRESTEPISIDRKLLCNRRDCRSDRLYQPGVRARDDGRRMRSCFKFVSGDYCHPIRCRDYTMPHPLTTGLRQMEST